MQYLPGDIRLLIYSYLTTKVILRKLGRLSKQERRLLIEKRVIQKGRTIKLSSIDFAKQTFLFTLVEKLEIVWSNKKMLRIGATELMHTLSLLPERLRQFNISLELMIDDRFAGKLDE